MHIRYPSSCLTPTSTSFSCRPVRCLLASWLLFAAGSVAAQTSFAVISDTLANPDNEPAPCHPVPSERQVRWQQTEFYAFFHYGMNTYTGLEWGLGNEADSIFAPTSAPNPRQWLEAALAAGMKGGIAVAKHHDGFCLWPTSTTTHNVTRAGNAYGRATNIPRDFAAAAADLGMKYGFYVSPWDRNSAFYGSDGYVADVFLRQCMELAGYGSDQFEMWLDGANGGSGYYGGRDTTVQVDASVYYDVPNLRARVHQLAPYCVMWGIGGEARWIGNEEGWAGETNWSMADGGGARGSASGQEHGWQWLPGESDAKATTGGWFWHSGETMLPPERLFQMYLETVGRNATLILNCPPDTSGALPEATVDGLQQLGQLLRRRLGTDLAASATAVASVTRVAGRGRSYEAARMLDGSGDTYWAAPDAAVAATVTLTWAEPQTIRYAMLMEPIRKGQRIRRFHLEISPDGTSWHPVADGVETTTVGYKRIVPLNGSTADSYGSGFRAKALRIVIDDSRACPLLSRVSVY